MKNTEQNIILNLTVSEQKLILKEENPSPHNNNTKKIQKGSSNKF